MNLPTPFTIGVRKHETGATDAHGNEVDSWGEPISVEVYSIAPATSNEPFEPGRNHVITGYTILAPPDVDVDRRDLIVIDGEDWKVEGEIANWNMGPFGWEPGVSINVERVEG